MPIIRIYGGHRIHHESRYTAPILHCVDCNAVVKNRYGHRDDHACPRWSERPVVPRTGRFGRWILRILDDHPEIPTWKLERFALIWLEVACHSATIAVAPSSTSAVVLLVSSAIAFRASLLAQTARSAAARKREHAEAQGLPPVLLSCELDVMRDTAAAQRLAAFQPLVTLVMSLVDSRVSAVPAAIVVALVSAARVVWSYEYDHWRRWMRARRPLRPEHPSRVA